MKLKKCFNCTAMIRLNAKRCGPCAGEEIARLHYNREKKARAAKRLTREYETMGREGN